MRVLHSTSENLGGAIPPGVSVGVHSSHGRSNEGSNAWSRNEVQKISVASPVRPQIVVSKISIKQGDFILNTCTGGSRLQSY